jgi:septal ring factor EnvC (AmiA/AmiB activator)
MTRRRSTAVLVCALALGSGWAGPAPDARAEDPQGQPQASPPAPDLTEYEKRLAQINDQILGLKARLAEEDKKQESILSQLGKISLTKSLLQKELSLYEVQLDKNSRDLAALRKTADELKARLDAERKGMERALVSLYKFGRIDLFRSILQAESVQVLFGESKLLAGLVRFQETTIAEYLKTLAEHEAARAALEVKRSEITALAGKTRSKRGEIEAEEGKNRELLTRIEQNKKTFEQTLGELKASAEELQALMKKLASQASALPFLPVPLSDRKGRLAWPIEGQVSTRFGIQRHARFNTAVKNNGIEIVPRRDNLIIQAVHIGKVVFADFMQGYGNLLILDHGLTYYTLYAHCSEFLVQIGDVVRDGQPLAVAGDYGSLAGPTLYFEIRFRTQALDPLLWLKKK